VRENRGHGYERTKDTSGVKDTASLQPLTYQTTIGYIHSMRPGPRQQYLTLGIDKPRYLC